MTPSLQVLGDAITTSDAAEQLPEEIVEIIRLQTTPQFLDVLATHALKPRLTLALYTRYAALFADTCSRWTSPAFGQSQSVDILAAFARILPLAPHLGIYLHQYLTEFDHALGASPNSRILWLDGGGADVVITADPARLHESLLAAWRLLNFDKARFYALISGSAIQQLLDHACLSIRYLCVRIFCQLRSASDSKLEAMIEQHVGKMDVIHGDFDGQLIDYRFVSIVEARRLRKALLASRQADRGASFDEVNIQDLSPRVVRHGQVLLPRPNGRPSKTSMLVPTKTTSRNLEALSSALLTSHPLLLHGLAGSGKTSLVHHLSYELAVDSSLVTLHLNEQTDAKMLIGVYATGATPGSFSWRAGVLTTAVREGRWVLIEDLDRAPNEVISVLLPLIERGELSIPSQGETIKASPNFRLFATIRTTLNLQGGEIDPSMRMLGSRFWKRVAVQMPTEEELCDIVKGRHPILREFLFMLKGVYHRVYNLSQKASFTSKNRDALGRRISPRDLLKWCRRLEQLLIAAGSKTGREPIAESTRYEMFMEAADCFAGSCQTREARGSIISCIAEEMHIDSQRVEHFLSAHIPSYEEDERSLKIGRVQIPKSRTNRIAKTGRRSQPFANTKHAKRLLEQVGVALKLAEPILLVGETGIGKTTVIQQLADSLGIKLTAINLSQQSEVGDLLGGYKPVNIRSLAMPLKDEFDELFAATGISTTKNQNYVDQLSKCIAKSQWTKASRLWRQAPKMFEKILHEVSQLQVSNGLAVVGQPNKKRRVTSRLESIRQLRPRWARFSSDLDQFDVQLSGGSKGFAFTFVEGNIIKAVRNGEWVLLDEINLASPDTLESIADLFQNEYGTSPSILLSETGEIEKIEAHPGFRIFGAMNPATDVGKKDLPQGLRSRFTEIFVESPDQDLDDLLDVIRAFLKGLSSNDERAAYDIARLYIDTKRLATERQLVDGANQAPHFSLRTLTRVLSFAVQIAPYYGLRRALYEGFSMGFLTLLNRDSESLLIPLINHHLLDGHGNPRALLSQPPRCPDDNKQYIRFLNQGKDRQYWMVRGNEALQEQPHYIITPFVERNMLNLVRATSTRRFPILIQGPTSSGKTSMIEYLAKFSGNRFVRINNHEHTDLQEYLGSYVSDTDGKLHFQEGLLVQALRQGHWIVLDELNLAPTDVLEALNRLLDDNRELLVPETQEIVRPNENFMLFATQNPPGLYGGRKTLSRAFRNRFLELHFDDIPESELDFILEKRSQKVAPSDCRRIVAVYKELSRLRQSNRLFEQKHSFATLRDLFRWALRDADNREQLAGNGYMLLAERVRNPEEKAAVKAIIEDVMKVKIDPTQLYDADTYAEVQAFNSKANQLGVVWTAAMRRLYILVANALRNNEPVLLVGETGCGKTTVCQMLAAAFSKDLNIVNAHQNTETGDIIGAQRPVRNRAAIAERLKKDLFQALQSLQSSELEVTELDNLLSLYRQLSPSAAASIPEHLRLQITSNEIRLKALFEWCDGSLVQAMRESQMFLLDEISLADDSVLERLNSVLEPQRTILLAEKGIKDSFVQAAEGFQLFATMNPGGDYGKRELSPALRNRFTEIWVPSLSDYEDIHHIVKAKLAPSMKRFAEGIVRFAEWFGHTHHSTASNSISVRDLLAWVEFINLYDLNEPYRAILHGAAMVYIDTIGANPAALLAIDPRHIQTQRAGCLQRLTKLLGVDMTSIYEAEVRLYDSDAYFAIGEFSIAKQPNSVHDPDFAFDAPTTKLNAMRILRALRIQKPILLEGNPGVGKTTLVSAIARTSGRPLTRINLSEQTDLMDLFGSDIPVEGSEAGHFAWRDAPFLQAMQRGEWVLLDEMNLASQSVLEGLNACLDHRGEVYVSELDQAFKRHPDFFVFAAQNPHHQGGGRKGLPSSFVNRFTVVYADVFSDPDLEIICKRSYPALADNVRSSIIKFVSQLEQLIVYEHQFGSQGSPWEINLRDTLRWLQLFSSKSPLLSGSSPSDFLESIFQQRFRTDIDRTEVEKLFARVFGMEVPFQHLFHNLSATAYQVGVAYMPREQNIQRLPFPNIDMTNRLAEIESVMICVQLKFPCILVGPSGSGKSAVLQHIAAASGKPLVTLPLNADVDTMDLVGGFEQINPQRGANAFLETLLEYFYTFILAVMPARIPEDAFAVLRLLEDNTSVSLKSRFEALGHHLRALAVAGSDLMLAQYAKQCQDFASKSMAFENARFDWVDGPLIKALEQGRWLILDNANLCSPSVLDRLNSLLEPNGSLILNEHCGPDGGPRAIKPHPDFRIFLTMDPRFGELSRAMRNRAIEIYLEPRNAKVESKNAEELVIQQPEASLQRYQRVFNILEDENPDQTKLHLFTAVGLDHLSWADLALLPKFVEFMRHWLKGKSNLSQDVVGLCENYVNIYEADEHAQYRGAVGDLLGTISKETSVSPGFEDAQTFHPLQNSPLVPLIRQCSDSSQIMRLGAVFEFKQDIATASRALQSQRGSSGHLKPSQMSRLQRSLVAEMVSGIAKDSTSRVAIFLEESLTLVREYLQGEALSEHYWKASLSVDGEPWIHLLTALQHQKRVVGFILQFWWDTYRATSTLGFEEARFQAHLAIGSNTIKTLFKHLNSIGSSTAVLLAFNQSLQVNIDAGFKLATGLSMEPLWKLWRPTVMSRSRQLQSLEHMGQLASRFDDLKWQAAISINELGSIMDSLAEAYRILSSSEIDGADLVKTLEIELDRVQSSIGVDGTVVTPCFMTQFEHLRQIRALNELQSKTYASRSFFNKDIAVLANLATSSEMQFRRATPTSRLLQGIDYIFGSSDNVRFLEADLSCELLSGLIKSTEVDLGALRLLEAELPALGRAIASSSCVVSRDQVADLNQVVSHLVQTVVGAHDTEHQQSYGVKVQEVLAFVNSESIDPRSFAAVVDRLFSSQDPPSSVLDLTKVEAAVAASRLCPELRMQYSAMAWVYFALVCIALYIPDRAFDPDIKQRLEGQIFEQGLSSHQDKLEALQSFERSFSGQESNLRCQLVEQDIKELEPPNEQLEPIYRPSVSELNILQGEFSNLLKATLGASIMGKVIGTFSSQEHSGLDEVKIIFANVSQIIQRLSAAFRAYGDLTTPAINLLHCLQIGLILTVKSAGRMSRSESTNAALTKSTPFTGGIMNGIEEGILISHPSQVFWSLATTTAVEQVGSLDMTSRQLLFRCFHTRYDQWVTRLETEREEADSKGGLYRFRGTAEDEDDDKQEFDELFPSHDNDTSHGSDSGSRQSARDDAIEIAQVHANIFLGLLTPTQAILQHIRHTSRQLGQYGGASQDDLTKKALPGALLMIQDQVDSLSIASSGLNSSNFYTDTNLPEARKLVALIHAIQARFRELQSVDEIAHMQPLTDVLASCDELLKFRHTEPLAKMITKVEKIHAAVHEWQFGGWASRANSCVTLYDDITSMIVSWRRLELSTWGQLFDMETRRCEDDAKSWWFIAYQTVVAAPLSMDHATADMRGYAVSLLKDLEMYFHSAIMGQFEQRLQLLHQLQKHLELLVRDYPAMGIIAEALTNFISLYSWYQEPVRDHLRKGRASLEKAMRDVLLLASWKDTNINALRESAKRSHHKLFKIVRKFRALLGQSMEGILKQELQNSATKSFDFSMQLPQNTVTSTDVSQPGSICQNVIAGWSLKPKRFRDVSQTVEIMRQSVRMPESASSSAVYFKSYLDHFLTTSEALRVSTPATLTDENTAKVKHLKNRKRTFFADVLKELRLWGIRYNLGEQALAKQDSLSTILAGIKPFPMTSSNQPSLEGCQHYLYKAIDMILRAREAARQHSEDLSGAEISRSVGYLEGLLQFIIRQRNIIAKSVNEADILRTEISMMKSLWASDSYALSHVNVIGSHGKLLLWLPSILSVGIDLINVHAKLSLDGTRDVQDKLVGWRAYFMDLLEQWKVLPILPDHITCDVQENLRRSIDAAVELFKQEVFGLCEQRPDLECILDQIRPWTTIESAKTSKASYTSTASTLDHSVSSTTDLVLTAVQDFQNTFDGYPSSTEETNWLKTSDQTIAATLTSLRCDAIRKNIMKSFDVLRGLDLSDSTTANVAGARYAVALPIFEQYQSILHQTITQYGNLHGAACKVTYILARQFNEIATKGFCMPSEKADAQDAKDEKLESGTGLGDGEGAENISKDIQDDEDLDELAQQPNSNEKDEVDNEQDAVDMADAEMEGDMNDTSDLGKDEEVSDEDSKSGDEMEEETGHVDDLDPTAVDEKKWDGNGEEAEKDQEGNEQKGAKDQNEQTAAKESAEHDADVSEGEEDEAIGAEQEETVGQQDVEKHDPKAQESEALDLPDDMQLDGDQQDENNKDSDDGEEDFSDVDEQEGDEDEVVSNGERETDAGSADPREQQETDSDLDAIDVDQEEDIEGKKTDEAGEKIDKSPEQEGLDDENAPLQDRNDNAMIDNENAVPSDVQGAGEDQIMNEITDSTDSASKAQHENGGMGEKTSEQRDTAASDGEQGRQGASEAPKNFRDEPHDSSAAQPFKSLGDALERWHRQQKIIREPVLPVEPVEKAPEQSPGMIEHAEFQHLQDENAAADTQALGTATEDQAQAIDDSMAIDDEVMDPADGFQPEEVDQDQDDDTHEKTVEIEEASLKASEHNADDGRPSALFMPSKEESLSESDFERLQPLQEESEDDVSKVDAQLSQTHFDSPIISALQSIEIAREQWAYHENMTRDLSLSLTEQLRLILLPTQATKMRGDFRTGKRLNIKRIIPYIASQYKRDKIWMRRSVPSKRSYQVMLAVDDSKSMGESGTGALAFQTLVLVSKSLTMLESGELCILGFGETVKIVHGFEEPFAGDAGPKVLRSFTFQQDGTNITKLVRESIEVFRTARQRNSSAADLWQLELIISDGVCDSSQHDTIRRLLREALEERIIVVFVVMDSSKGQSVMDLKAAQFEAGEVKIIHYFDGFPFQNYLVVRSVQELPGVLAMVLRTWLSEVAAL